MQGVGELFQGSNPGSPDRVNKNNSSSDSNRVEQLTLTVESVGLHSDSFNQYVYLEQVQFEPESQAEILFQYEQADTTACLGDSGDTLLLSPEKRMTVVTPVADEDVALANRVTQSGRFNFQGERILVQSKWNTDLLRTLLEGYHDIQVADFLEFGWPIDRDDSPLPAITGQNHLGARQFECKVDKHINKELQLNALAGPYDNIPPEGFTCSPLNTRPKRNSVQRRIIYDLSWEPNGFSVNAGISKHQYLDEPVRLRYPTVQTFIKRIKQLHATSDQLILMYKRDWARAFSQLPLDPAGYRYVGFFWKGKFYFSKVIPMGLVSACLTCQRTTSAIRYIMNQMGFYLCNYIDDMVSAELVSNASKSYQALGRLFRDIGAAENLDKAVEPTTEMEFVGNLLNTISFTISVTPDRRRELKIELEAWAVTTKTNR